MGKKNFGSVLRNLRLEKKMSLREFSEFIGISHAYINKIEKSINPKTNKGITPTIETLIKIADALKIPLNKFLYMCGYIDEDYEFYKERFEKSLDLNVIDIKRYTKEIINNLKNAKLVTCNRKKLRKGDIKTISQVLKIAVEMTKKDLNKKTRSKKK
jgi:Predicted transcriptional regulators